MLIVSKGTVIHDGKTYQSGEIIVDITGEQRDRLVSIGACKYIPDRTATAAGTEPDASAGGNIPADAENAEKQPDAEALNLDVDPAKAIQTNKKK